MLTLARGAFSIPLLMSMSEAFFVPFLTLIKLFYTKALEWSNLVPSPKAKSSPSGITNLTSFTVSYHLPPPWNLSPLLPPNPGFPSTSLAVLLHLLCWFLLGSLACKLVLSLGSVLLLSHTLQDLTRLICTSSCSYANGSQIYIIG